MIDLKNIDIRQLQRELDRRSALNSLQSEYRDRIAEYFIIIPVGDPDKELSSHTCRKCGCSVRGDWDNLELPILHINFHESLERAVDIVAKEDALS